MAQVEIVRATWRDARALAQLDRRCFSRVDAFSGFTFLGLCLWPDVVAVKAMADGKIVGFVAGDLRRRRGHIVIVTLSVDPAWRRRGIAERLMRECEARFNRTVFRLQVRKSNTPAIQLYKKVGYSIIGTLPGYYEDEDGYLMEKKVR
jgi:ribosomal-protein-alanine N-acetyltransferase